VIINLAYLAKPTRGGWPTYTAHLFHGLQEAGHSVQLWRLGNRTETKQRPFGRGLTYTNATAEYLAQIARTEKMHITAAEPAAAAAVATLLRAGATITIHDPTELKGGMVEALQAARQQVPVSVIRNVMHSHLESHGISCQFVPHPYQRMPPTPKLGINHNAVAFSRLDWDKGTHHFVAHNKNHGPEKAIYMWGAENRLYTHHKLVEIDPGWRRYYRGQWPVDDLWAGTKIAQRAHYALDFSAIKGDGGGTQYTFLEALDGGATLILNKEWLVNGGPGDEMWDYANFVGPEKIRDMICGMAQDKDPSALFERHDARARALETVGLA
jgi:hypothetical protein